MYNKDDLETITIVIERAKRLKNLVANLINIDAGKTKVESRRLLAEDAFNETRMLSEIFRQSKLWSKAYEETKGEKNGSKD